MSKILFGAVVVAFVLLWIAARLHLIEQIGAFLNRRSKR